MPPYAKQSILLEKCVDFSVRIVNLYKYLRREKGEDVMSKQILRSGTSVGAQVSEGRYAESKTDFIHKYAIGQKECSETIYWLLVLARTGYISESQFDSLHADAVELQKLITASIKTAKSSLPANR